MAIQDIISYLPKRKAMHHSFKHLNSLPAIQRLLGFDSLALALPVQERMLCLCYVRDVFAAAHLLFSNLIQLLGVDSNSMEGKLVGDCAKPRSHLQEIYRMCQPGFES